MTNKEAIKLIQEIEEDGRNVTSKHIEALDLAIKALEERPQEDNAPTVSPQKVVTIPHELIEKLVLCVVDTVENIDWDKAIEAYKERPHGKWIKIFSNPFTNGYICSFCGHRIQVTEQFLPKVTECEACGAKMDGKEADNEQ